MCITFPNQRIHPTKESLSRERLVPLSPKGYFPPVRDYTFLHKSLSNILQRLSGMQLVKSTGNYLTAVSLYPSPPLLLHPGRLSKYYITSRGRIEDKEWVVAIVTASQVLTSGNLETHIQPPEGECIKAPHGSNSMHKDYFRSVQNIERGTNC